MGASHKWLRIIRRKFLRSSNNKDIIHLHSTSDYTNQSEEEAILRNEATTIEDDDLNFAIPTTLSSSTSTTLFTKEDVAAIKIQAYFRGHLARRAYGALRSLVKVQALVRGVFVRKQSRIAMQCMHALVRLQVSVRARQLLGRFNN